MLPTHYYPILSLKFAGKYAVAISGPKITVFYIDHENERSVVYALDGKGKETPKSYGHSGPVSLIAVEQNAEYIVSIGADDKKLNVWSFPGMELLSTREIPKKGTQLTLSGQTIIVADKFGDVFSYPLFPDLSTVLEPKRRAAPEEKRQGIASHENELGSLVLGHASMITATILSQDEKYIITSDRDEHIRVSWFPLGYNIETYCFGHTRFVSALSLLANDPGILVSAGGDPDLYVWDWARGALLFKIPFFEIAIAHMQVNGVKLRKEVTDAARAKHYSKKTKKIFKQAAKQVKAGQSLKADELPATQESAEDRMVIDGFVEHHGDALAVVAGDTMPDKPDEEVPVVSKLISFRVASGSVLMWSVLGANAIFYLFWGDGGLLPTSKVNVTRIGSPVVDFTPTPSGDAIFVTMNVNHQRAEIYASNAAVLLRWNDSHHLMEDKGDGEYAALLDYLNNGDDSGTHMALANATEAQLEELNLYDTLLTYPKRPEDGYGYEEEQGTGDGSVPPEKLATTLPSVDKRGNTGERAKKRKRLRENLQTPAGEV